MAKSSTEPTRSTRPRRPREHRIELDATDRRLLALLQEDSRIPNAELAEQVGLSPSPTLARVRKLERQGVITIGGDRLHEYRHDHRANRREAGSVG